MNGMEKRLTVFADYSQFYLEDAHYVHSELPRLWDEQSFTDMIAAAPGVIAVGTARNFDVPVTIRILNSEPEEDLKRWDHVAEAYLAIPSGVLLVFGPTDWPDAERIMVEPSDYRVRVHYANLESVAANGIDGEDSYEVVLWPGGRRESVVLRRSGFSTRRL